MSEVDTSIIEKWTSEKIVALKGSRKIAALTAYDYPMAVRLDQAGIPFILVGDSLGMVVLGYSDTTQVSMDEMEHHVRAVARARPRSLIVADLPAHAYDLPADAVRNAKRLISAGAEAVKAEGGKTIVPQVEAIVRAGIPFCGHLGMLPQHVNEEGGYKVKGKVKAERIHLLEDARCLEQSGAFAVVLELVTKVVANEITSLIRIPTIGIGSGDQCDGQILVTTDLWGTSPGFIPKHVKNRLDLHSAMVEAVTQWRGSVETGPEAPH